MNRFEDRETTKQGSIGEQIVIDRYFIPNDIGFYRPNDGVAHLVDFLCFYSDKKIFAVEVKSKPAREYYPDTGINTINYNEYLAYSNETGTMVLLLFVDAKAAAVYGGWIDDLSVQRQIKHEGKCINYPLARGGITYFPVSAMKIFIDELSLNERTMLDRHATRKKCYEHSINDRMF